MRIGSPGVKSESVTSLEYEEMEVTSDETEEESDDRATVEALVGVRVNGDMMAGFLLAEGAL